MTALEILQPHKQKKFIGITDYDFDYKDYRAANSDERLGKLMLAMVDGPESLTIREASKRLGLSHSHAKFMLKFQRKIHSKTQDWAPSSYFAKDESAWRSQTCFYEPNEEDEGETIISDSATSAKGSEYGCGVMSVAGSDQQMSDFSDCQGLDMIDRKFSHSSFKRLSAFSKAKMHEPDSEEPGLSSFHPVSPKSPEWRSFFLHQDTCVVRCQAPQSKAPIPVREPGVRLPDGPPAEGPLTPSHPHSFLINSLHEQSRTSKVPNSQLTAVQNKNTDPRSNAIIAQFLSWGDQKWQRLDFMLRYLQKQVERRIALLIDKNLPNSELVHTLSHIIQQENHN